MSFLLNSPFCLAYHTGFTRCTQTHIPRVFLKLGPSIDGHGIEFAYLSGMQNTLLLQFFYQGIMRDTRHCKFTETYQISFHFGKKMENNDQF